MLLTLVKIIFYVFLLTDLIGENDTLQQTIAEKISEIESLKSVMSTGSRSRTTSETEVEKVGQCGNLYIMRCLLSYA